MMKLFLIFIFLFILLPCAFAQSYVLVMTKIDSGKEVVLNENDRVIVRAANRMSTFRGKLAIVDLETIKIKNNLIDLDDIIIIKQNQLGKAIVKKVFLGITFAGLGGFPYAVLFGGKTGAIVGFSAMGAGLAGFGLMSLLENKYKHQKWSYEILEQNVK